MQLQCPAEFDIATPSFSFSIIALSLVSTPLLVLLIR